MEAKEIKSIILRDGKEVVLSENQRFERTLKMIQVVEDPWLGKPGLVRVIVRYRWSSVCWILHDSSYEPAGI